MAIELVVPLMMICMTRTVPGIDDGSYSTVAKMETVGCTPCNPPVKECAVPADFQDFVRRLVWRQYAGAIGKVVADQAPKAQPIKAPRKPKSRKDVKR